MNETDPPGVEAEPPSLIEMVRALIEDARMLFEAEVGYWRTALAFALGRVKSIIVLAVLALFFAFFTLLAVVVGLLLALAPFIGAWGALGAVSGTLLLAMVWCGWLAMRRGKQMMRALTGRPDGVAP